MPRTPRKVSTRRLLGSEQLEARALMAAYISEVHFSPLFGTATEDQYVELRGEPNARLSAGTYFVAVGGADGVYELGDVHSIFDLSNHVGYWILHTHKLSSYAEMLSTNSP